MKKFMVLALFMITTSLLTGCASQLKNINMVNDVPASTKMGVVVTSYKVFGEKGIWRVYDQKATDFVSNRIVDTVVKVKGDTAVMKGLTLSDLPGFADKYEKIAKDLRSYADKDAASPLGDMSELFAKNDIDLLVVFSGVSDISKPNAMYEVMKSAPIGALTQVVGGFAVGAYGGAPRHPTTAYLTVVDKNGKFVYYSRKRELKGKGDFANPDITYEFIKDMLKDFGKQT